MSEKINFSFDATERTETGKAHARRLRRDHKLPGIIYGAGTSPLPITLEHKDVQKTLGHEAVYSHILTVNVGKNTETVVLKAVERHHIKPQIMHIDFQRIKADEKLTMRVPLHFSDEEDCPGVKSGGVVSHLMTDLEIKCLPSNLPQFISIDIKTLELDTSIHLMDIKLPKGVELAQEIDAAHNQTVVSVHRPKKVAEEEPTEEGVEEKAEEGAAEEKEPGSKE